MKLTYKGYTTYSYINLEQGFIWGKLDDISDLVTWECDSVAEVKKSFHGAVESYIGTCKEVGKEPEGERMSDYKDADMWLMKGDCLERMKEIPDGSVDLVLTDPPYNISKKNNFHTMEGRVGIDFGEWDKGFDLFSYIDTLPRILNKNGSIVIFNDWKNLGEISKYAESKGFVIKDMLRWEKSNPMPRNKDRRYITDFEVAVWLTMPKAKWVFNRQTDTYERPLVKGALTPKSEKVGHTTQKPLYLMEHLLKIHSNKQNTILDLFMGSGTTGLACKNLNRKFIGIELDDNYYNIAKNRILGEKND